MTTVEVNEETLERLKEARELIKKKLDIKMRMPDMMSHLVQSPEEVYEIVSKSINKKS